MSNAAYPESVRRLIDAFAGMPGIGRRSAAGSDGVIAAQRGSHSGGRQASS